VTVNAHDHAWGHPEAYPWVSENTPEGVETMVYTVENLLADAAEYGIGRTCLVATPIHGRGSPYTMDCLAEYPESLCGIALLDYFADDVTARIETAFETENLLGFRLGGRFAYDSLWERPTASADWLVDDALAPFWDALAAHEDRDPHVHLFVEPEQFDQVEAVVADNPGVTFVLDHLGLPTPGVHAPDEPPYDRIAAIAAHSNAYVKLTRTPSREPYPFADIHDFVASLLELFGSERCLWGSDYIYHFKKTTFRESRDFLDHLELTAADKRDLLGRSFERIA
jgi:L-fuconolactonase